MLDWRTLQAGPARGMANIGTGEPRTFSVLLRSYRLAAGLSQEALAERARISLRGLSDLERGSDARLTRQPSRASPRRCGCSRQNKPLSWRRAAPPGQPRASNLHLASVRQRRLR
jgi:DNA-binding XRE family transcriptional regulator